MSTSERDELDECTLMVNGVGVVNYRSARRIVDGIKAKLDAVTRERDEIASRFIGVVPDGDKWGIVCDGGKPVYATVVEACEAADKINRDQLAHHQNGEYEWRQKFHELERQVNAGIQPSVQLVLDRMNEWNKQRDQIVSLERDQAREQLAAVQAEAVLWRMAVMHGIGDWDSIYNQIKWRAIEVIDPATPLCIEWCQAVFLKLEAVKSNEVHTAGREVLEEVRRDKERIAELERTWDEVRDDYEARITKLESENYRYGESYQELEDYCARIERKCSTAKAALVEARERIAELEAQIRDGVKAAYDAAEKAFDAKEWVDDQPTPEPVYWRCGWTTSAQEQGRPDYRCLDGVLVQISSEQVDEWVDHPASVADIDSLYPRCNRDGTPIVKETTRDFAKVIERNLERDPELKAEVEAAREEIPQEQADDSLVAIARELREALAESSMSICRNGDMCDSLMVEAVDADRLLAIFQKLRDSEGGDACSE